MVAGPPVPARHAPPRERGESARENAAPWLRTEAGCRRRCATGCRATPRSCSHERCSRRATSHCASSLFVVIARPLPAPGLGDAVRHNTGFPIQDLPCRTAISASRVSLGICLMAMSWSACSAALPEDVLLRNRWVEIARADLDNAIARMPENVRAEYANSAKRVENLLNQCCQQDACRAGARVMASPASLALPRRNRRWCSQRRAPAGPKAGGGGVRRGERRLRNAGARNIRNRSRKVSRGKAVRVAAITIRMKNRSNEATLARAKEARARVAAGEDLARWHGNTRTTG